MEEAKRKLELDPDYIDLPEKPFKKPRIEPEDHVKNYELIVQIIQREFQKDIYSKREEIHKIQQQLLKAQKTLHLLKYVVVKSFYESKELKLTNTNEVPVLQTASNGNVMETLMSSQSRLHPAVKKLIGKKPLNYEPYRTRTKNTYGNKKIIRKGENVTIKEEETEEVEKSIKIERVEPELQFTQRTKVIEDATLPIRNRDKNKYRILIGNISKWMPSNSAQDNSTHKWMVYVRGPKDNPDISHIVKKVRFFLHPSYQPNDIVDVQDAPFHLSRRGWGEFPLRVQIHFRNSKNKPIDIIHNIRLDRTYTGRQTMGEETLVDTWLYDRDFTEETEPISKKPYEETPQDYLKKEYCELDSITNNVDFIKKEVPETQTEISNPVIKCEVNNCDRLTDFIENCEENLKELEEIEKDKMALYENHKSEELTCLDTLLQIEEIAPSKDEILNGICDPYESQLSLLNSLGVKEVKNPVFEINFTEEPTEIDIWDLDKIYLEDHCYTKLKEPLEQPVVKKSKYILGKNNWTSLDANYLIDKMKYKVNVPLECFKSIPQIIYYMLKSLPLVSELANQVGYTCLYPFTAATLEQFLSWNPTKQFCSEWYRAKYIKNFLIENNLEGHHQWTVKVILMYGQAHGFSYTDKFESFYKNLSDSGKSLPNRCESPTECSTYTEIVPLKELLEFKTSLKQTRNDGVVIDVLESRSDLPKKKSTNDEIETNDMDDTYILPCTYVRETANQIGIHLEPEEIIEDISYRATERVILKSVMCLAEELIRKALANNVVEKKVKNSEKEIDKSDIFNVLLEREEFGIFLNAGLGKDTSLL